MGQVERDGEALFGPRSEQPNAQSNYKHSVANLLSDQGSTAIATGTLFVEAKSDSIHADFPEMKAAELKEAAATNQLFCGMHIESGTTEKAEEGLKVAMAKAGQTGSTAFDLARMIEKWGHSRSLQYDVFCDFEKITNQFMGMRKGHGARHASKGAVMVRILLAATDLLKYIKLKYVCCCGQTLH